MVPSGLEPEEEEMLLMSLQVCAQLVQFWWRMERQNDSNATK